MSIYHTPTIISDPRPGSWKGALQAWRSTIQYSSLESAITEELPRTNQYAEAFRELRKQGTRPVLSPEELFAIKAFQYRSVLSSHVVFAPYEAVMGPEKSKHLGMLRTGDRRGYRFAGYTQSFDFLYSKQHRGTHNAFIIAANVVGIDVTILEVLEAHDGQHLLRQMHRLMEKIIHEPFHNITLDATANPFYRSAKKRKNAPYVIKNSLGYKQGVPGAETNWLFRFPFNMKYGSDYELLANRVYKKIAPAILGSGYDKVLLEEAKTFLSELASFREKIADKVGTDKASAVTMYLACAYTWPLHVFFTPKGPEMETLVESYAALGIKPLTPVILDWVKPMQGLSTYRLHKNINATIIALLTIIACKPSDLHEVADAFIAVGRLPKRDRNCQASLVAALKAFSKEVIQSGSLLKVLNVPHQTGLFKLVEKLLQDPILRGAHAIPFWTDLFKELDPDKQIPPVRAQLATMRNAGLLSGRPQVLSGYDAICYCCTREINGFFDKLHEQSDTVLMYRASPFGGYNRQDEVTFTDSIAAYSRSTKASIGRNPRLKALHFRAKQLLQKFFQNQRREAVRKKE